MIHLLVLLAALLLVALAGLALRRLLDQRAARREVARLRALQPVNPARFSNSMVEDLPEPLRRFFGFMIEEGAPLYTVAEISMQGTLTMGDPNAPRPLSMTATQILAAPEGFVWQMSGRMGGLGVSGSDTGHWTRFWLAGLFPVARAGGSADHRRSAFGRYVSEAIFWTPAALLPGPGVAWEALSDSRLQVTVTHGGLRQEAEVTIAEDGRPVEVVLPRWSNANPEGVFRVQPFGGTLSEFRVFEGFRLPTHVEAGNFFGTEGYAPFFIADISEVRFPQ